MLVITRKVQDAVRIGGDIRVVLVSVDRNKVRIGVECPRDVPVWRAELIPDGTATMPALPRKESPR